MAEIDPGEQKQMVQGATSLLNMGERWPIVLATTEEILVRELDATAPGTIDNIRWSLAQVLDVAAAYFVVRYLTAENADEVLDLFRTVSEGKPESASVEAELRRLQALFGRRMSAALHTWNATPDDWSGASREVLYDVLAQEYRIHFQMTKYSGEEFLLIGQPGSLLNLATSLLKTLNLVPEAAAFPAFLATDFRTEAERLLRALQSNADSSPPAAEGPGEGEPSAAT